MQFQLLKPNLEMEAQYYDFIADWEKNNEEITPKVNAVPVLALTE